MLKFLHCADIHLDTPFSLLDIEQSELRRAELRTTFSSMMCYIRENDIRLALFAGDLFNNSFVTRETIVLMQREFAAVPMCHIVIAPGNHDFYTSDGVYAKTAFSENVHIFRSAVVSCFSLLDIGVDVWGFANTAPHADTCFPLEHFRIPENTSARLQLFCAHADTGGSDTDIPQITKEQLAHAGFAYAALGHQHNSDGIRRIGATYFGYAGCLEGRSFEECGYKGAVCGEFSPNADGTMGLSVRRLRFSRKHYETETLDITGCESLHAAAAAISAMLAEKHYDRDTALRLILTGTFSAAISLNEKNLAALLPPLLLLELCDRTTPDQNLSWLENDPTLRGAFYRELLPLLNSANENDRETAYLALRLGLQAMNET